MSNGNELYSSQPVKTYFLTLKKLFCFYNSLIAIQLTCKSISNPKQPSCKKVCGPQECCCEKRCEIQSGGQEMAVMIGLNAKILIMTIQVNLVRNHSETWRRRHKFTWIVVIKILVITLPSQPFLASTSDFTSLRATHFFYIWAGLD